MAILAPAGVADLGLVADDLGDPLEAGGEGRDGGVEIDQHLVRVPVRLEETEVEA